jgi:beta-ureidopropionase
MTGGFPLSIALIQGEAYGDPASADVTQNLQRYVAQIEQACLLHKPALVVLPEMFTAPYFCSSHDQRFFELAETVPGPTTQGLAALAREHRTYIAAPIFERVIDGEYYDSCALLSPTGDLCLGEVVGSRATTLSARKVHLPSVQALGASLDEKYWFRPGGGLTIFDTDIGRIGILICYDRSFPEAWRTLVLAGAELILIPVASHGFREKLFVAELQTLAAGNGVWALACNRVGPERVDSLLHMFGNSCVVSPRGDLIAHATSTKPEILHAVIDMGEVAIARQQMAFLRDRRPDCYHL